MAAWVGKWEPKRQLRLPEVITLTIMRFYLRVQDLKTFHRLVRTAYFPHVPNYENFLKKSNASFIGGMVVLNYLLAVKRRESIGGCFFMDSTALSVCHNHNFSSHRVTNGYSARGMSAKGWFYGFKLHGVCDCRGNLVRLRFSPGNEYDNQEVTNLTEGLFGRFVGDAGYILKEAIFQALYEKGRHILHGVRKNMKRVMSEEQQRLFRKRSRIETVWDVLKERYQMIWHLAWSITGLFRHYVYSFVAFLLQPLMMSRKALLLPLSMA